MKKRIYAVGVLLGTALIALAGRTFYIQVIGHEELAQAAAAQQRWQLISRAKIGTTER